MNIFLSTIIIAVLYGTYDLFIKLGAGRIDPAWGALLTQVASAVTLVGLVGLRANAEKQTQTLLTPQGVAFVIIAGALIATTLALLFILLQNKEARATTTLPTILILRNITLVILGILVLRENLSLIKVLGIALSLFGIYLISF